MISRVNARGIKTRGEAGFTAAAFFLTVQIKRWASLRHAVTSFQGVAPPRVSDESDNPRACLSVFLLTCSASLLQENQEDFVPSLALRSRRPLLTCDPKVTVHLHRATTKPLSLRFVLKCKVAYESNLLLLFLL